MVDDAAQTRFSMGVGLRTGVRGAVLAAVLVAILVGPGSAHTGDADRTHERDPLAVQLGALEAPDSKSRERPAIPGAMEPAQAPLLPTAPPDSLITALMDSTSLDRIVGTIQRLQDYGTRYVTQDSCWAAGYWIHDQLEDLGYEDVRLDTFRTMSFQDSVDAMNVIAVKEGVTRPSEYVVIGGHYDSVSALNFEDPDAPAPGAEDNATAVAAVLEAARLLHDIPTDRSIMFASWSAEEEGTWGSRAFVRDALAESLDIVVYLNMDCIGYLDPEADGEPITVYTDSLSLAIAGYMQTLAHEHTPYGLATRIQPFGASDHYSFWEARYRVVDSGTTISSPYRHTADDVLENIDPEFCRAIAAINVAATAAVAGVAAEDRNLPPETVAVDCCAAVAPVVGLSPTFEWYGVDFDGEVTRFEHSLDSDDPSAWQPLPPDQTSITLAGLEPGPHVFRVRATDDDGAVDPSPVTYEFVADASLRPVLTVEADFLPEPLVFTGPGRDRSPRTPTAVFEGERLSFTTSSDASWYCGTADSVSIALNDPDAWSDWRESPHTFAVAPTLTDSLVFFRTRDENGAETIGEIAIAPVATPGDRPLLRVDDWCGCGVAEDAQDAFYELILAGDTCDVWDPFEHIEGYTPTLPSMEELGHYRTIIWTLDERGGFLRAAQAESAYHWLEGFVRAGGNLILEGQGSMLALIGADQYTYEKTFAPGDFVFDYVGVDSFRNAGSLANPSAPSFYGYAFLGGVSADPSFLPDAPVDTLGRWAGGYASHGGLPLCDIVRPREDTRRLYLFDSYINPELDGRPCATMRNTDDGTGSFVWLGFPLYYIQTDPASRLLNRLLRSVESWLEPAELSYFTWRAGPDSVALSWYLTPADPGLQCTLERKNGAACGSCDYTALTEAPVLPDPDERYRYADRAVESGAVYSYRLKVRERNGAETVHGPWEVSTLVDRASPWLAPPSPNPFTDQVTVSYVVAADYRWVTVRVHDVAGRLVKTLSVGPANAGRYDVTWDGTSESGQRVASGVYFVRARVGGELLERKVVLLR